MTDSMSLASDLKTSERVIYLNSSGNSLSEMIPVSAGSSRVSSTITDSAPSEAGSAP